MSEESSESHELDDEYVESTCLPRSAFDDFFREIEGTRLHRSQLDEINDGAPLRAQWLVEQVTADCTQSQEQQAAEFAGPYQATWAHHHAIEVEAARLADVCRKSTGQERESNIRQLREAESDLEQFRDSPEFQEALNYTVQAMRIRIELTGGADQNLNEILRRLHCLQERLSIPKPAQSNPEVDSTEPSTVEGISSEAPESEERIIVISSEKPIAGVDRNRILAAFPPPSGVTAKRWSKRLGEPCKKMITARVFSGGKGGVSSLWNPAKFAIACAEKKHMTRHNLTAIMRREFSDWLPEWEIYVASFG